MAIKMHLDGETFSSSPIKDGLDWYFLDPSYELLMLSYAIGSGPAQLWEPALSGPPADLVGAIGDPTVTLHAHNAVFEWHILRNLTGRVIPLDRFYCTQVRAYSLGFSGTLADIQDQVGLPQDVKKLRTGKALINRFCKPAPRNHKADRYTRDTHPEEWAQFREYCLQDTVAERALELILDKYPKSPPQERDYWLLDHKINQRGMRIDQKLARSALAVDTANKKELKQDLIVLTGLENPGSQPQFLDWIKMQGFPGTTDVQKATLQAIVDDPSGDPVAVDACRLRLEYTKTSNAKWAAMLRACGPDGRLRNVFQFAGAQRTARWAGRIVQTQNLPGSRYSDPEEYNAAVDSIKCRNPRLLRAIWGDIGPLLSQSIRGAIIPEEGNQLAVADASSIESRVLGWVSECTRLNRIFAEGKDSYRDFASDYFRVGYDEVTKAQRKFAKPPVLGCGYMLGWRGLQAYAEGYGVELSDADADRAVRHFRSAYPEIPRFWGAIMDAVRQAIHRPGDWFGVTWRLSVGMVADDMLGIRLPSGRIMCYHRPRWDLVETPWGVKQMGFTYMGQNQLNPKWTRIDAHAGKVTENIVQAISRDLLAGNMLEMDRNQVDLVLHVHDEVGAEVQEQHAKALLGYMKQVMSTPPPWAPDMVLGAEGWVGEKYRKD